MSKDSERQAWTEFVEAREREAKRPRTRKRAEEEALQAEYGLVSAELDDLVPAELDDLVTVLKTSGRTDAKR